MAIKYLDKRGYLEKRIYIATTSARIYDREVEHAKMNLLAILDTEMTRKK